MRYHLSPVSPTRPAERAARRARRGFTLIEAAMVTVIIGIGVVGMLELLAAGTLSNTKGTELTTAINLANNIREVSLGMAFLDPQDPNTWNTKEKVALTGAYDVKLYDNVLDLDGERFSPPIDVRREPIAGYDRWEQSVKVETVASDNVASVRPNTTTEPTARVTVTIKHGGTDVYVMSWLAVAPKAN